MREALEIFGLEMCDAYSRVAGERWFFKKIDGKWVFREGLNEWREIPPDQTSEILSNRFTVHEMKAISKRPRKEIQWVGKISRLGTKPGTKS